MIKIGLRFVQLNAAQVMVSLATTNVIYKHRVGAARQKVKGQESNTDHYNSDLKQNIP